MAAATASPHAAPPLTQSAPDLLNYRAAAAAAESGQSIHSPVLQLYVNLAFGVRVRPPPFSWHFVFMGGRGARLRAPLALSRVFILLS